MEALDLLRSAVFALTIPCFTALSRQEQYFLKCSSLLALSPLATVSENFRRVVAMCPLTDRLACRFFSDVRMYFAALLVFGISNSLRVLEVESSAKYYLDSQHGQLKNRGRRTSALNGGYLPFCLRTTHAFCQSTGCLIKELSLCPLSGS